MRRFWSVFRRLGVFAVPFQPAGRAWRGAWHRQALYGRSGPWIGPGSVARGSFWRRRHDLWPRSWHRFGDRVVSAGPGLARDTQDRRGAPTWRFRDECMKASALMSSRVLEAIDAY